MWEYNNTNELYHYGVPGMKWGHRNKAVKAARREYKQARKAERKLQRKHAFSISTYAGGVRNNELSNARNAKLKKLAAAREKAALKAIDTQAKAEYDIKLAKTNNKAKAEKASMKMHYKAMKKRTYGTGRVGGGTDQRTGDNQAKYYDHMVKAKGKEYANKVETKYNKYTTKAFVSTVALQAGNAYIQYRYS